MLKLTKTPINRIKKHSIEEYPKEAVGIISGRKYIRLDNIADKPTEDFKIKDDTYLNYDIDAIYHSHPEYPAEPSESDMFYQINSNVPWIIATSYKDSCSEPIIFGDDYIPDLVGREFRHGPSGSDNKGDCYALIKDYYKLELNIELPEFPRNNFWWENSSTSMYEDNFEKAGFVELKGIDLKDIVKGDIALMRINSNVINHAAVYVDNGLILHHLTNRLSRKEPATIWRKMIIKWLRYKES